MIMGTSDLKIHATSPGRHDERMAWWRAARFGIHWDGSLRVSGRARKPLPGHGVPLRGARSGGTAVASFTQPKSTP